MDAWDAALQFLLIDNRAHSLAHSHPLTAGGRCRRCGTSSCAASKLASEALRVLAGENDRSNPRYLPTHVPDQAA
jgi:hypothetical protein